MNSCGAGKVERAYEGLAIEFPVLNKHSKPLANPQLVVRRLTKEIGDVMDIGIFNVEHTECVRRMQAGKFDVDESGLVHGVCMSLENALTSWPSHDTTKFLAKCQHPSSPKFMQNYVEQEHDARIPVFLVSNVVDAWMDEPAAMLRIYQFFMNVLDQFERKNACHDPRWTLCMATILGFLHGTALFIYSIRHRSLRPDPAVYELRDIFDNFVRTSTRYASCAVEVMLNFYVHKHSRCFITDKRYWTNCGVAHAYVCSAIV